MRTGGRPRASSRPPGGAAAGGHIVRRPRQRGLAAAMVMTVILAMMVIGVVGMGMMMAGVRTAGSHRTGARALFCAEAGLAAGRAFFSTNVGLWNAYLRCNTAGACPAGYPMTGTAGADGSAAYVVTIADNYDELPPAVNDPLNDSDLSVVMIARCTDPLLPPRTVKELVTFDVRLLPDYRAQAGLGRGHAGNQN